MNIPPSATASEPLGLEFAAKLDGGVLTAGYRITNRSPKPVYLLNGLWTFDGSRIINEPRAAYVALGDDGVLHLAKQVPPLPRTRTVELRIVPYAQKLEPGVTTQEMMTFPVPVEEYNPYFLAAPEFTEASATAVVFALQFIRAIDELEVKPAPLEGLFQLWHKALLTSLETVRSRPVRLTVPVRRRVDEFERF